MRVGSGMRLKRSRSWQQFCGSRAQCLRCWLGRREIGELRLLLLLLRPFLRKLLIQRLLNVVNKIQTSKVVPQVEGLMDTAIAGLKHRGQAQECFWGNLEPRFKHSEFFLLWR